MSRKSEFQSNNPNPATKFLEWKSNDKCFSFWDRDTSKNIEIKLPFRFLVLKEMHTVKGWNDASESRIYSNEVKFIGKEELTVKSFKGGEIAKGLYKEIKSKVKDAGGVYHKSLYIMTEAGEIINLAIKGSAAGEWGEFTQKSRSRLFDEWITVADADDRKKGATKYSVPVFKYDSSLSKQEGDLADERYKVLQDYILKYERSSSEREQGAENIDVVDAEVVSGDAEKILADELDL